MVFDKPQWLIVPDVRQRKIAGLVSNLVTIIDSEGMEVGSQVIIVPSSFLHFLSCLTPGGFTEIRKHTKEVTFYLESMGPWWAFGFQWMKGDTMDLWAYRSMPKWVTYETCG